MKYSAASCFKNLSVLFCEMNILWFGSKELYTTQRMQDEALRRGDVIDSKDLFEIHFNTDRENNGAYSNGAKITDSYDAIIVRTFHPYISEALTLARLFRDAGKTVIDESLTDEGYAVSKMHDYLLLAQHGVPVPRTFHFFDTREVEAAADILGYPCILKGVHGTHGSSVYRISNKEELHRRLWKHMPGDLMIQEFLEADEDYRVITIGYKALPVMVSRRPPEGDFRTNYAVGGQFESRDIQENFRDISEASARALRREFAAVDIRCKNKIPLVLEVNRRPDFEGFESATKFNVAGVFLDYITEKVSATRK